MPYPAQVLQILLSGPDDVSEVRDAAIDAIHNWNFLNSERRGIMLHPLTWATHVSPSSGKTAQAHINSSIVEKSDFLVGFFWTRFGSPTDKFGSGTEEEISAFISSGRQAMLYFSDQPVAPSHFNGENTRQYEKVRAFKKRIQKQACWRALKTDHLCSLKIDQGWKPGAVAPGVV